MAAGGPPTPAQVYGPLLIGVFLNVILYGVVVVQAFTYYRQYKRDATWIRYFILYLFVLETINTVCNIGMMYEPLILKFGDPTVVINSPNMLIADPIITALISTSAQLFISWRIKIISGSIILPIIIGILSFISFGGGLSLSVLVALMPQFHHFRDFQAAIITWLTASAVADLVITVTLTWSLTKRKTGIKGTDDRIASIIRFTIHTGLLTAIMASTDALVFLVVPNTTLNFIWDLPLAKVYAVSILSTLNARAGWNGTTQVAGSSANENNVLFGRHNHSHSHSHSHSQVSVWKPPVTDIGSFRAPRGDHIELEQDSKHRLGQNMRIGVEHGITVTTIVESQQTDKDIKRRNDSPV